jgi:hypothetical protein
MATAAAHVERLAGRELGEAEHAALRHGWRCTSTTGCPTPLGPELVLRARM